MSEKEVVSKKVKESKKQESGLPVEVLALAKELGLDHTTLLGYQVYDHKVVVIGMNGMKFSKEL